MQGIDIIVLICFILIIFSIGMSFASSGKDMKSFFAAGGAVPWWINGLSLFMSFFSSATFVAWGSIAYSQGVVSLSIQWMMCIAGLLVGTFVASRWRKTNTLTVAEYLTKRFGYKTQRLYTWLFLVIAVFTTGAFLYPVAKIVEVSTGLDISQSIIILGVLITLYTTGGGLWAVIVTDVLQFVVLTAAVFIAVPLSFKAVGGYASFVEKVPETFFEFTNQEYSPAFLVAFCIYNLVFIGGNWAYVQRYSSVASPKDAKKVGWLFSALYTISPVIWMIPPMLYRAIEPNIQGLENEGAYLMACKAIMPVGLLGLIIGGMVFATASSVNTALNISAGVLTNDVYKRVAKNASDKKLMVFAKITTLVLGVLTIIIALLVPYMGGILEVILSVGAITGGAMFLPPIWSLFSNKLTRVSLLGTTVLSLLVNIFFKFFAPILFGIELDRAYEMILGVLFPVLLLSVWELYAYLFKVSVATPKLSEFEKVQTDIDDSQEVAQAKSGAKNNREGIIKIGFGIVGISVLLIGVGVYTVELFSISMGSILLVLSGLMIKANRTKK